MRRIADMDAADYLAWKVREEMLGGGHVEPPSEKELAARFRKIILERPVAAAQGQKAVAKASILMELAARFRADAETFDTHQKRIDYIECASIAEHWADSESASPVPAAGEGWTVVKKDRTVLLTEVGGESYAFDLDGRPAPVLIFVRRFLEACAAPVQGETK